jgi:phage-related protein
VTAPGGSVGSAYISFHARTDRLQPELEAALRDATNDADDFLDRAGTQWGSTVSESTSKEIRKHGHDFADSIEHSLTGQVVSLGGLRYKVDRRGFLHDFDTGQFAGRLVDNIVESLEKASTSGGPFSKVGEGIADAVGAGFNVSGKSPLIAFLVPLFGAIAGAIIVVVQAVNALAAVLTTIPALVLAIGLQAGVLMLAFDGVGTAIQGAFAAKNWNEFYAAIQGLTPAAQNFIVTLLPLRDLIKELKASTQQSFFTGFGNTMVNIIQQLGPILRTGLPQLAFALGGLFKNIGLFFASPAFVGFVNNVIPATIRWLGDFGPGFVSLLTSLVNMANTALPFLERLGQTVTGAFGIFTSWLNDQTASGGLTDWLDRMAVTIDKLVLLFFNLSGFVVSFLDALDKAGGNQVIDEFGALFQSLGEFFGSEAGVAAMMGFVHAVEALTFSFAGLIYVIAGLLIAFEAILQFFGFLGAAFMAFVDWLTNTAGPAIGVFFTETLPGFFEWLWERAQELWNKLVLYIEDAWNGVVDFVKNKWDEFGDWFQGKVDAIVGFFQGIPDRLADIGRSIMNGLKEGLQWGWDHTVGPILNWITSQIPNWKGPLEKDKRLLQPAGKAIMGGFQQGLMEGAEQLKGMLGGFTGDIQGAAGAAGGSPIVVNQAFHGAVPTEDQAYSLGRAAGKGVSDQMAAQESQRNIKLAVRMA